MQSQACLSLLGFISFVIGNFWVFEVKQSSRNVKAGIATYKFFNVSVLLQSISLVSLKHMLKFSIASMGF